MANLDNSTTMTIEHARCRTFGHEWNTEEIAYTSSFIDETLECDRCGTRRVAQIARRTGYILSSYYKYPKDYQRAGGVSQAYRGKLRLQVFSEGGRQ